MSRYQKPYSAEFRQQMVDLVRIGRTPTELAKEFGCSSQVIANWVAAADGSPPAKGSKMGVAPLSSAEREELEKLRRENRQLKMERDILSKATAWFANRGEKTFTSSSN